MTRYQANRMLKRLDAKGEAGHLYKCYFCLTWHFSSKPLSEEHGLRLDKPPIPRT